jgi:murein tripeptide amidase MpaA
MLNPDGVILGNHRTSVSGKDLNREFLTTNKIIFPEVIALKEYVADLKSRFSNRLLAFFDIHGHSMRKNAFIYGP